MLLNFHGVRVPKFQVYKPNEIDQDSLNNFSYPGVCKPAVLDSSEGISQSSLVKNPYLGYYQAYGGGGLAGDGPGGGAGYYGGGAAGDMTAGAGGGSSYVPAGGTTMAGSGGTPGNSADSDRGGAGVGVSDMVSSFGTPGRIKIQTN